jgi:hypothetical protein
MATGVQSSVTLGARPSADALKIFTERPERVVTVVDMCDGRVHISCYEPVSIHHADLPTALRERAVSMRSDLEGLNA